MRTCWGVAAVLGCLTCCTTVAHPQPSPLDDPVVSFAEERYVLSRKELDGSGAVRLVDLLSMIPGWDFTTLDGVSAFVSPMGLDAYGRQRWQVLLDGHPVPLGNFGSVAIDRIPVALASIDSVEVFTLPVLQGGVFAEAGLIHFHTSEPEQNLNVTGVAIAGNETGDPGPYHFTDFSTPNVERIGPDAQIFAEVATGPLRVVGGYASLRDYATDVNTSARNEAMAGDSVPTLSLDKFFAGIAWKNDRARHQLSIGYSRYKDFFYVPPYAQEIPTEDRLFHSALDGRWSRRRGRERESLSYRMSHTWHHIDRRENQRNLDLDWEDRELSAAAALRVEREGHDWEFGASLKLQHPETGLIAPSASIDRVILTRVHGTLERRWAGRLSTAASAMVTWRSGRASPDAALRLLWKPMRANRVLARLAFTETLPEEDGRIWFWNDRGYRFLEQHDIDVIRQGPLEPSRTVATDVRWRVQAHSRLQFMAGACHRGFEGLAVERQRFAFGSPQRPFESSVELAGGRSGQLAGLILAVEAMPQDKIGFSAHFRYWKVVEGDNDFRREWQRIPRHMIRSSITYSPVPRLRAQVSARYWSDTEWPEYAAVFQPSVGRFPAHLEDQLSVDLAIEKLLWRDHMRVLLGVRNLLDRDLRYHPAGETFALTVFFKVEMGFSTTIDTRL